MSGNIRTYGEVFFEDLNDDEYLKRLYEDLLFNYSLEVFQFVKKRKRHIPIVDVLSYADLLSKSNHPRYSDSQKMWAQEIITLMHYLYPDDERVSYVGGSVLEAVCNYRGKKILKTNFNGVDLLDRIYAAYKEQYFTIPSDAENKFMVAQKKVYDHLADPYFSYSGPTSMGKSYLVRMFIKNDILAGSKKNYAIVVPTKALINEVRSKIVDDLKQKLNEYNYHIVVAAGDAVLESKEHNRNYIFIMTPERLLYLLINEPEIKLDYLFIDEAHKLSDKDKRSPFYYQVTQILTERSHRPNMIFASPNVPNPEIYLDLIPDKDSSNLVSSRLATTFSPVSQEKFIVNLDSREVSIYNERTKNPIPITFLNDDFVDITDVLLHFQYDANGKENKFIAYFSSTRNTVTAARDFAANRMQKTNSKELMELSKEIKNEVHNDYYLADLISKGVAYHIGYLPSSIRQRIEQLFKEGKITALFCTSTLVEGVNLPADNLFVMDYRNGLSDMKPVDFRNLIGRVGRLEYNLYGNVFLVAQSAKYNDKYIGLLEKEVEPQKLSIQKGLTKPQKKKIIEFLLEGNISIDKYPIDQSADNYDLMRKFAIILMNDIVKDRNSRVLKEFQPLLHDGDKERIKQNFCNERIIQDDDITTSVDQVESLYQAIAFNNLEFPAVVNGCFNREELGQFLERLCRIFNWEKYESDTLGRVSKKTGKHALLHWYQVILSQWVQGSGLQMIMYWAIKHKEDDPDDAMFIDGKYYNYNGSIAHKNIVISETLDVIENVILFKFSNYFLKVSNAYKEIRKKDPPNDWYEYVEYGSLNKSAISLQKHGFSRESALYLLDHIEYIDSNASGLKLKTSVLLCPSRSVRVDAEIIKYNTPELFVD